LITITAFQLTEGVSGKPRWYAKIGSTHPDQKPNKKVRVDRETLTTHIIIFKGFKAKKKSKRRQRSVMTTIPDLNQL
jgi:hypothetical protein